MLKQKTILILAAAMFLTQDSYGTPESPRQSSFLWTLAFDIPALVGGVSISSYQLALFVKELVLHRRKVVLKGNSENDLCFAPLNEYCRLCLSEKSSGEMKQLCEGNVSPTSSEAECSAYRRKMLCHFNLYQFPVFLREIKKWPEYRYHVAIVYDGLKTSRKFRTMIESLQGFKRGEFAAYFKAEYLRLGLDKPLEGLPLKHRSPHLSFFSRLKIAIQRARLGRAS